MDMRICLFWNNFWNDNSPIFSHVH